MHIDPPVRGVLYYLLADHDELEKRQGKMLYVMQLMHRALARKGLKLPDDSIEITSILEEYLGVRKHDKLSDS